MSEFRRRLMMQRKADNPILNDYLTIVALEDGLSAKLSINACEYCVDGDGNWKTLPADTETQPINKGQTLSFRATLSPKYSVGVGTFSVNKNYNLRGNCMSLLFGDDKNAFSLEGKRYAFARLFMDSHTLKEVSKDFIPATTLGENCYHLMFHNCTNLIVAPQLPAMVLARYCYYQMFQTCTMLVTAPDLPAEELAGNCYEKMFFNCYNLIVAPKLPALNLTSCCYKYLFRNCYNLLVAPKLPAVTLVTNCYNNMFYKCNKLNYIEMLATDINADDCLTDWVNGVAEAGIFVKSKDATWDVRGVSGIPEGWEVITE